MTASSEAPTTQAQDESRRARPKRRHVNSTHVAPRGQRHTVARPIERTEPAPLPAAPTRRRLDRGREKKRESVPESMTQPRSDPLTAVLSGRMVSAVILFALLVVLFLFFQSDAFYVDHIEVGGMGYMSAEEIFALSETANTHLFWLDAAQIEASVLRSPNIAAADVSIGWPPHILQIEVEERQPALVWEQSGYRTWIDVQGRVMPQRSDIPGLLRIVADGEVDALSGETAIPQEVVDGALQLKALYPGIDVLVYNAIEGLGYQDGRGWRAWFGSGRDMPTKLAVYETLVADLLARGIQPEYIDVGNPDAPYYKYWWGREADQTAPPVESAPADTGAEVTQ